LIFFPPPNSFIYTANIYSNINFPLIVLKYNLLYHTNSLSYILLFKIRLSNCNPAILTSQIPPHTQPRKEKGRKLYENMLYFKFPLLYIYVHKRKFFFFLHALLCARKNKTERETSLPIDFYTRKKTFSFV